MTEVMEGSLHEALKQASKKGEKITRFVEDMRNDSVNFELPEELARALDNKRRAEMLERLLKGLILLDELEKTSETGELSAEADEFKKVLAERFVKLEKTLECSKLLAL